MTALDGRWNLRSDATISVPDRDVARLTRALLGGATGFDLLNADDRADVVIRYGTDHLGNEGYRLVVTPDGVTITASDSGGAHNALQTLRQLLPPDILRSAVVPGITWDAPCVDIVDHPRFRWRGVHIDVSRHFTPIDTLHRFVDLLALHKLNVLHLHLTDDQGWRFPSESYPRLADVASWRLATPLGLRGADGFDLTPHGGCYTRTELADLVTHAAALNVVVLPEIDLPGHTQALLAAYPDLGNGTGPYEVRTTWGISTQVLGLHDEVLEFCRIILGEVMDVFPSHYIHIGGDEVPQDEWRHSPRIAERKRQLGLVSDSQLQHWFTSQLHAIVTASQRALVGWDEILEGGDPPVGAAIMSWRGTKGGVAAARAHRDVIMCPERPLYLDHYQADGDDEPLAIGGLNDLASICAYSPIPPELDESAVAHILGSQVQLWTEYLPDRAALEYMAFPRASAFADALWNGHDDDVARRSRVEAHLPRLDTMSVGYRPLLGPHPWQRGGGGRRRRPVGV